MHGLVNYIKDSIHRFYMLNDDTKTDNLTSPQKKLIKQKSHIKGQPFNRYVVILFSSSWRSLTLGLSPFNFCLN